MELDRAIAADDFDSAMRRFESSRPSQDLRFSPSRHVTAVQPRGTISLLKSAKPNLRVMLQNGEIRSSRARGYPYRSSDD
jgi:hypothetical protein